MIPEFQTERLLLRPFTMDDFEAWYPLDQDPRVMQYIWKCKPKPMTREDAIHRLEYIVDYHNRFPGFGIMATIERSTERLMGWTALKDLDQTELIEIGYRYFPEFWGKGYATEAAGQLVGHGFKTLDLPLISAVTHPDNKASKRVLQKLGLQFVRKEVFYDTDVDYFELKQSEYLKNL